MRFVKMFGIEIIQKGYQVLHERSANIFVII